MNAAGFTLEDVATDPVEIWPDNLRAVNLFAQIGTQWRTGMGGPTGLDYNVLYRRMDRMGLAPDEYDELEADIQAMEGTALNCMHASR